MREKRGKKRSKKNYKIVAILWTVTFVLSTVNFLRNCTDPMSGHGWMFLLAVMALANSVLNWRGWKNYDQSTKS